MHSPMTTWCCGWARMRWAAWRVASAREGRARCGWQWVLSRYRQSMWRPLRAGSPCMALV